MIENGYGICFNSWAFDNDIKNELGLLLIISSLSSKLGYCSASNEYLSNLFKIDKYRICKRIKRLEKKGYIRCEYDKRGTQILSRKIYILRLPKTATDHCQKRQPTIAKNGKENNTSVNNIDISKKDISFITKKSSQNGFSVPSISEIEIEFQKHGFANRQIAQSFFNHYENKRWYIGKNKMQSWKRAVLTWVNNPDNLKYKAKDKETKEDYLQMLRRKRNES